MTNLLGKPIRRRQVALILIGKKPTKLGKKPTKLGKKPTILGKKPTILRQKAHNTRHKPTYQGKGGGGE